LRRLSCAVFMRIVSSFCRSLRFHTASPKSGPNRAAMLGSRFRKWTHASAVSAHPVAIELQSRKASGYWKNIFLHSPFIRLILAGGPRFGFEHYLCLGDIERHDDNCQTSNRRRLPVWLASLSGDRCASHDLRLPLHQLSADYGQRLRALRYDHGRVASVHIR